MAGGSGIHLCQTLHHHIICLGSPKPRMTTLLYINLIIFFPRWFSTSTSLGGRKLLKLLARFLCPTCNGCSVSSENPFWWALWWVHSPTPNASLQLPTEGKDSFLDTKQRCQSTDCPLSVCGTPTLTAEISFPHAMCTKICVNKSHSTHWKHTVLWKHATWHLSLINRLKNDSGKLECLSLTD